MYNLTNNSRADQIISLASGRRLTLRPEATERNVDISEKTADRLRKGGNVKVIAIGASGDYVQTPGTRVAEFRGVEAGSGGGGGGTATVQPAGVIAQSADTEKAKNEASDRTHEAADLINRYQARKMNFGEFSAEAKVMLGDKWPGGVPRKSDLLELLRSV